jgi:protein-disulfide isomerase
VSSTPTLVVGDEPIVGVPEWDVLKATIERKLAQVAGRPAG